MPIRLSTRDPGFETAFAALLAATPREIAQHAGISTPVPKAQEAVSLTDLAARLERVEAELAQIKALLERRA